MKETNFLSFKHNMSILSWIYSIYYTWLNIFHLDFFFCYKPAFKSTFVVCFSSSLFLCIHSPVDQNCVFKISLNPNIAGRYRREDLIPAAAAASSASARCPLAHCGQRHRCRCSSKHFLPLPLGPILNNGFQTMTPLHFPPLIIQKIGPEDLPQSSGEMCQAQGCVQTPIIGSLWDPRERLSGLQDSSPKLPHLFRPRLVILIFLFFRNSTSGWSTLGILLTSVFKVQSGEWCNGKPWANWAARARLQRRCAMLLLLTSWGCHSFGGRRCWDV